MPRLTVVLVVLLALAGCGAKDTKEIKETRTVTPPPPAATPAMPPGHDMQAPPMEGAMPPGHPSISPYKWQVPEGWSEVPATSMRIGNFKIAASPEAECYLTVLKGAAGGVDANINRWRRQMGQPELKAEEIAALTKVDILGQPAPFVEVAGSFTGMAGQQFQDYTLMGAVAALADQTLFIKMTGPTAVMTAEKDHFQAFCKSLTVTEAAGNAAAKESKPVTEGEAAGDAGAKENK